MSKIDCNKNKRCNSLLLYLSNIHNYLICATSTWDVHFYYDALKYVITLQIVILLIDLLLHCLQRHINALVSFYPSFYVVKFISLSIIIFCWFKSLINTYHFVSVERHNIWLQLEYRWMHDYAHAHANLSNS